MTANRFLPTPPEFFALLLALLFPALILILHRIYGMDYGADFASYIDTANGETARYFYPYWTLLSFKLLALLPFALAYLPWNWFTTLAVFAGVKLVDGPVFWTLLSYQMLWCVFYGQIVGWCVLGLGLAVYAVERQDTEDWQRASWWFAIGILLLTIKPQVGLAPVLVLFGYASLTLKIRAALVYGTVFLVSLVLFPGWPETYWHALRTEGVILAGSIGLWPYSAPLWTLVFLPRWTMRERLVVACACSALAMPYFQHSGLLLLFALTPFWVAALGNLGYAFVWLRWPGLSLTMIAPLSALVRVFWDGKTQAV